MKIIFPLDSYIQTVTCEDKMHCQDMQDYKRKARTGGAHF